MPSDAQKRAKARYDAANMVNRSVKFSPNERDLLAKLDAQPNKAKYIKDLIRADIEGRVSWDGER